MVPYKVLLLSADASLVQVVNRCLIDSGYKVINSSHGIGVLNIIRLENPTLIILDVELPGINSLAIIRTLRSEELKVRTPIILIGTNLREEDVLIGIEAGADLCLQETFHPQVFIARVRSLIHRIEP
jgi:DNA-binding response OmpR family regulator